MPDTCPTPLAPSSGGLYWSTPSSGKCQWEKTADTDLTRYSIIDTNGSATVAKGTTQGKMISFSSFPTHSYKCILSYINSCGESSTFEISSSVVIRPTPTDTVASVSATLTPTLEASPSPSLSPVASPSSVLVPSVKPTIRQSATPIPTTIPTVVPKSNTGSVILLGVLFFVLLLLGLVIFLLKKKSKGEPISVAITPGKNPSDPKDASGLYYVKPYKLEDEGKSMWLILTQGQTQILGLYSGTSASEGNAKIKGKYEEADGVKFIEIESLTFV